MKWLDQDSQWQFEQIGSDHWSRAGELQTVGNTLGSTLGTPLDWRSPMSPYLIISHLLYLLTFYTQGAQEPSCWVSTRMAVSSTWAPLSSLLQLYLCLYWPAASLPSHGETVSSRIQWGVCPWPPKFIEGHPPWRGEGSGQGQSLAVNQGVSVTNLQRTGGQ